MIKSDMANETMYLLLTYNSDLHSSAFHFPSRHLFTDIPFNSVSNNDHRIANDCLETQHDDD